MPEIAIKALKAHLTSTDSAKTEFAPVYLLHGDEYLYKKALAEMLNHWLSPDERSMRCTTLDGSDANLQQALNELNTYSLLGGRKIVVISEARVFYSQKNKGALLDKARTAAEGGRLKAAAAPFISYLGLVGWKLEDVAAAGTAADELRSQWGTDRAASLDKLLSHCRTMGYRPASGTGGAGLLTDALEKGFPRDHHLVLTTDLIDKRRKLYKRLKADGVVVDCSVPKGARFADKQAQEQLLRDHARIILQPTGKSFAPKVFEYVCEMTGFDLRTFAQNLEKLTAYIGERPQISMVDARKVLARTRTDPIFELTNALFLRDADGALFYLRSMLKQEMQPLQVLAAITNQLRKVMLAKDMMASATGGAWVSGMPFARFKSAVMPALQACDQAMANRLTEWASELEPSEPEGNKAKRKSKPKTLQTDLVLAKNPQSAYPVYQLMLKADKFSHTELLASLAKVQQTDRQLKGGRMAPALILENLIISICRSHAHANP